MFNVLKSQLLFILTPSSIPLAFLVYWHLLPRCGFLLKIEQKCGRGYQNDNCES
jgi:hypothetical protein